MAMWEQLKNILAAICPGIATALGGPLAGTAVTALSQALLGKSKASPDELLKAIASPEALLKAQQAENQFMLDMEKVGLDREKLEQLNVDNARNREIELAKVGKRDYTTSILAFLIVLGFFGMLCAIWYLHINPDMERIADIMIGALGAQFAAVCNYYFGSSKGSRDKDAMIASKPR